MLAEALEHLVRGVVEHPDDVVRARQAAASRVDPRGAGAPRRPRQGDRSRWPHRDRVPHRDRLAGRSRRRADRLRGRRPTPLSRRPSTDAVDSTSRRGRPDRPAHGLRGEVSVEPRTDEPERRFAVRGAAAQAPEPLADGRRPARTHSGRLLVRFEEIADRTAAEAARGTVARRGDRHRRAARGPRGVLRPPAGRAARRDDRRRRSSASSAGSSTTPPRTCSSSVRRRARCSSRSWPRWSPRSTYPVVASSSTTGPGCSGDH